MKPIWKVLVLGAIVLFLMQSCVTVRSPRHPHRHSHRHRHCLVVAQLISSPTLFTLSLTECPVVSEPVVYGNKG